jgi:CelD/BcsL family acetyltransferase involved in cellulose biosynthesis
MASNQENNKIKNSYKKNISITIVDKINDEKLMREWKRLETLTECHPQMYYDWCRPWWELQSRKRKLYILMVESNDKTIGIAPLCIENRMGLKIIRSFPIHFGDFYEFIIERNNKKYIYRLILEYLMEFKQWSYIQIDQVNSESCLYKHIMSGELRFKAKTLTGIVELKFSNITFEEYFEALPTRKRKNIRRRLKRLQEYGDLKLTIIDNRYEYYGYMGVMKNINEKRWGNDNNILPDEDYEKCRMEAIGKLYDVGKAVLVLLKLNGEVIAYRLGILHKNTFYAWKFSFDPQYKKYSPGSLMTRLLVEKLIDRNVSKLNYGCGEYDYKLDWSNKTFDNYNYTIQAANKTILAKANMLYQLKWRDSIKSGYHKSLRIKLIKKMMLLLDRLRRRIYL